MTNKEIERKWLVKDVPDYIINNLDNYVKNEIVQGYISHDPHIRVRKKGDNFYLNFKKVIEDDDIVRDEYEFEINESQYNNLIKKSDGVILYKTRYVIPINNGLKIELDFFHKDYEGLIYAEIEFKTKEEALAYNEEKWFYKELTGKKDFTNVSLSISKKSISDIYKI